jgi:hypothetical protein
MRAKIADIVGEEVRNKANNDLTILSQILDVRTLVDRLGTCRKDAWLIVRLESDEARNDSVGLEKNIGMVLRVLIFLYFQESCARMKG